MSTIFWEISKRNIRIHMLRSTLAMLGIIIGVVAIGAMGILGNSMTQEISSSLSSVGDSVIVTPYSGGGGGGMGGGGGGSSVNLMLTDQNYQQIKRVVAPNVAIPVLSTSEHMKVGVGSDDIVATIYGIPTNDESDLLPELQAGITTTQTPAVWWVRRLQRIITSRSVRGFPSGPMGNTAHSGLPVLSRNGG